MSEIHDTSPEKVVKKILDHVLCNVRETFAVRDTGTVNVETVHTVNSVANVDSATLYKLTFEAQAKQLSGILWWQVWWRRICPHPPQTQKYQGLIIFSPLLGPLCTVSWKRRDLRARTDLLLQNPYMESRQKAAWTTLSLPNQ